MPASSKMLKSRQQKANRAAGLGDKDGRMPSCVKKAEVSFVCSKCMNSFRQTKTNAEAAQHRESRHPTCTFAECFPGQFDPASASQPAEVATEGASSSSGGKMDIDRVRAEARQKRSVAEGGGVKPAKKGDDLSFLDASLTVGPISTGKGKKK